MKRLLPFTIIVLVLAFSVGAYWFMTRPVQTVSVGGSNVAPGPSAPGANGAAVVNAAPGAAPAHFRGPETAPAMLEEFGDFECPPCGAVYPILKQMESEFGSRLRVTFREFPLTPPHVHALAAARAAEAAGLQGKFFEMHDMLYENQATWKDAFDVRPIFEGYASRIGLDLERFKSDSAGDAVGLRITLDGSRGHSFGVKGTPTVFLNGTEIPFEQLTTVETFRAAINKGLSAPAK